jgi:conjugative transposon TraN protein
MKIISLFIIIVIGHSHLISQSFTPNFLPKAETIPLFRLSISDTKTSNLVFPYDIKSVDRGSRNLLVQKARGSENILQIKAATQGFQETNLSVITADKKLYSFLIRYDSLSQELNYRFAESVMDSMYTANTNYAVIERPELNDAEIQQCAAIAANIKPAIKRLKNSSYGIKMQLDGVFIKKDMLFFSLRLKNSTPINYDVESLHFLIKDMTKGRRTAVQELLKSPVYIHGNAKFMEGHTEQRIVVAIPKFTIPDRKVFVIQLREVDGGRHVGFHVTNKRLIKAKPL